MFDITKLQRYDGIDLSMAQVRNENVELNEVWTLRLHITKPQYDWQVTIVNNALEVLFTASYYNVNSDFAWLQNSVQNSTLLERNLE